MKLNILLKHAVDKLEQQKIATACLDARILMQHATGLKRETIYLDPELEIAEDICLNYTKLIDRRCNNEPVAKIIANKGFWQSDFIVNNHTLDPRPDSETIIEAALKLLPEKNTHYRFLDLGTGSGCLLLSLLQEFPYATGIASDISAEALKVAKQNTENLGLQDRVSLIRQNWADGLAEKFDLIVSNPPYIPSKDIANLALDVKNYDPLLALDGGSDGLDPYRYLAKQILLLLKPNAYAILEFGMGQLESIQQIFKTHGYIIHASLLDLNGLERAIIVRV